MQHNPSLLVCFNKGNIARIFFFVVCAFLLVMEKIMCHVAITKAMFLLIKHISLQFTHLLLLKESARRNISSDIWRKKNTRKKLKGKKIAASDVKNQRQLKYKHLCILTNQITMWQQRASLASRTTCQAQLTFTLFIKILLPLKVHQVTLTADYLEGHKMDTVNGEYSESFLWVGVIKKIHV